MKQLSYEQAQTARLDLTFAALANPTRRAILAQLAAAGEVPVTELARSFTMTQPAISRHLKVLEEAGLISTGSDAQRRPRTLNAAPLAEATAYLATYREFWDASFARLDDLLGAMKSAEQQPKPTTRKRR